MTYAFGDIHGCLTQLQRLVELCERDAGAQKITFIFLGDYICLLYTSDAADE